jgi:two-component sensor histidine kinase
MPLALIVNELVTNAVKHSSFGQREVSVRTRLSSENNAFVLCVEDDGPGFDFDSVRSRASGLRLVQGLARQLRGEFEVMRNPTRCCVRFGR